MMHAALIRRPYTGPIDLLPPGTPIPLALGMRRLTRQWTGPLLLCRRGSDSATLDIPACPDGSICRETLAKFCAGTDGYVRQWYDQSGNNVVVEQTSAASQPLCFTSGDLIRDVHGRPRISHTTTGMIFLFSGAVLPQGGDPITNFSVYRRDNTSGIRSRWSYGTNTANLYRGWESDNGLRARITNGTTNASPTASESGFTTVGWMTMGQSGSPNERIRIRVDDANVGGTISSATATAATVNTGSTFGKIWGRPADATSANGYSYEYIFCAALLTDAQVAPVYREMEEYYGINK